MYILNTEAIANSTNAELAAGNVCNRRSTNVWVDGKVGGLFDVAKLPEVADDCVHPVLNSDPGVLALLASDLSERDKLVRYMRLENGPASTSPRRLWRWWAFTAPFRCRTGRRELTRERPAGARPTSSHRGMAVRPLPRAWTSGSSRSSRKSLP